jgi:hypothetical protein
MEARNLLLSMKQTYPGSYSTIGEPISHPHIFNI